MGLFQLNFFSQSLKVSTNVNVLMPTIGQQDVPKTFYGAQEKYKVLWLLHGSCSDANDWLLYTNVARYAESRDLIVVLPSALNSDYSNYNTFADGFCMWDYLTEELMPLVYNWLPASSAPEDNFIAGLSMGGNGALMFGLGHPELFGGIAVLSSTAREVDYLYPYRNLSAHEFRMTASDPVKFPGPNGTGMRLKEINQIAKYPTVGDFLDSCENAWDRLADVAHAKKLPPTYVCCGTKDINVYPRFLRFRHYAQELAIDSMVFEAFEGYKHEYPLWDIAIQRAMEFFGIPEGASKR